MAGEDWFADGGTYGHKKQDGDAEGGGEWCTGILLMLHFGKGLLVRSGGRFSKIQKG